MTKPYSEDLRTRVVAAVVAGASCRDAAQRFSIGVSSVVRWAQRFRRTGSVAAKPMGGERNTRLKDERDWLLARVAAAPDLPLHDITRELAARNVRVGYGTIWRFFAKEKITFKKIVCAAEQDRPDVAAERMRWQEDQKQLNPKRLVFIDETWAKTNMAPAHGRCRRGQRLYAKVPHGHWKTTTFVAALPHDGITAPFVLDGPINGKSFLAYVKEVLAPTLSPGDIVLIDNLASQESDRGRGRRTAFLPRYSPDLNPIEMAFSKLKTLLRKASERFVEALWSRIGELLSHFPQNECQNYFKAAGYEPT